VHLSIPSSRPQLGRAAVQLQPVQRAYHMIFFQTPAGVGRAAESVLPIEDGTCRAMLNVKCVAWMGLLRESYIYDVADNRAAV
jgi:hypothetical protein